MLTDTQLSDTRRYAGYPFQGDVAMDGGRDLAYGWVSPIIWQTLQHRLTTLRPEEEARIITFLTTLAGLETGVTGAAANLDTEQAAVWTRNKDEVADRMKLYRLWRRELCAFIGVPPGPGLGGTGSAVMARC